MTQKRSNYTYTALADLSAHAAEEKVYIFAVVAEMKNISSAADVAENVQFVTELHLQDASTNRFTRCVIYSERTDTFAKRVQAGQIIQLHRIRIRTKTGRPPSLHGTLNVAGLAVVLINVQPANDFSVVYHSFANYSLPADYEKKIASLRPLCAAYVPSTEAAAPDDHTLDVELISDRMGRVHHLNELTPFQYRDVVVQAISVLVGDMGNTVLRCWDTTTPPSSIFFLPDKNISEVICINGELDILAEECHCDVVVYGEHGDYLKRNVKPGDILLLTNLHYYMSPAGNMLSVHEGGKRYNRSIKILDDSYQKAKLLSDIKAYAAERSLSRVGGPAVVEDLERATVVRDTAEKMSSVLEDSEIVKDSWNADTSANTTGRGDLGGGTLLNKAASSSFGSATKADFVLKKDAHVAASLRHRQIHAVQLGWIAMYVLKKWISEQNSQLSLFSSLERSHVLASRGAEFLIRFVLKQFKQVNRDSLRKIIKVPLAKQNSVLEHFLLVYLNGAYENVIRSHTLGVAKPVVTIQKKKTFQKRKQPHEEQRVFNQRWEFVGCIAPGTSLKFSSWPTLLSYDFTSPIFTLVCTKCDLWRTTLPKSFAMYKLCPACFKGNGKRSQLSLQCYLPFSSKVNEEKMFFFLFPVPLLAFFLVGVPETAEDAAKKWRNGLGNEEKQELFCSIQEKMLLKYSFSFTGLKMRGVTGSYAVFEVEKLTFSDRI